MFNNSGAKIQTIAKILFVINLIGVGVGFLVMLIMGIVYDFGLYIGMSFVVLIGGLLVSYIESLIIYSFGELVKNTKDTKDSMYHMEQMAMRESIEYEREKDIKDYSLDGIYANSAKNKIKIKDNLFEHIINGKQYMFGTVNIDDSGDIILTSKDNKQRLVLKQTDDGLVTGKGTLFQKEE